MAAFASILAGKATISITVDGSNIKPGLEKAGGFLANFAATSTNLLQSLASGHYLFQNIIRPIIDLYA